jgi:hypothetical protein
MKNRQPSLMVHTNPEFETSSLILDFEFDQHLGSHKHVINIIMWFRDMGCYSMPFELCEEFDKLNLRIIANNEAIEMKVGSSLL